MIYFGENNEYILCECEICKGEMYIERTSVTEEDAYAYHLYMPVKCRCGAIDEYINRAKKSCHSIKHELSTLHELLRRQQSVSAKISDITTELNKKFTSPSFLQSIGRDIVFSIKVFFILLGSVIGLEIFLFIITSLMFFFGVLLNMPDVSKAGNELFYHINIFKDMFKSNADGFFVRTFESLGFPLSSVNALSPYSSDQLIFDYIPYAVAGVIIIVFYVFLAVLAIRVFINVARLTFFASRVVNRKIRINQKKEEYRRQLDELSVIYQTLSEQINDFAVLPADYKNLRAVDTILRYFINNRADTVREAVNLFHDEDFKNRQLEYSKAMYAEARQTRRYTKALYMLTSDENIKVDVKDVREESHSAENDNAKVGEMLKDAFAKIKKSSPSKVPRLSASSPSDSDSNQLNQTEEESTETAPPTDITEIPADLDVETIETVEIIETAENTENTGGIEEMGDAEDTEDTVQNLEDSDKSESAGEESLNAIFDGAANSKNDGN